MLESQVRQTLCSVEGEERGTKRPKHEGGLYYSFILFSSAASVLPAADR